LLPPSLEARVRTPEFWYEYLYLDDEVEDSSSDLWTPWEITFPLGTSTALQLDADRFASINLSVVTRGSAIQVAFDDQAHWHPHALRWSELEAISRRVAVLSPSHAHPGVVLLLLTRFAPIASEADADLALPLIRTAWLDVGVDAANVQEGLLRICDFRRTSVSWREVPSRGWCIEQNESNMAEKQHLYSLRVQENDEFPWAEWRELMVQLTQG
jgi:hypothetical protein